MKFNEKLMELRRKEGLSQEELGYKFMYTDDYFWLPKNSKYINM